MLTFLTSIGTILIKILLLVFVLGIIILVHEFGHFVWAKKFGVHIYEFSIGMGPLLYSHKGKDKIDYNIRWIPIGGYVSMAGEVYDDADKSVPKSKLLCNKPWYQRMIIMVAGVVNNFILAILLLIVYAAIWGGGAIKPTIGDIEKNSAAEKAGLVEGDTILSVNNKKVSSWDKAQILLLYKNSSEYYTFDIKHEDGTEQTIKVKPEKIKDEKTGKESNHFGMAISSVEINNIFDAVAYGFQKFWTVMDSMIVTLGGLFSGNLEFSRLSGPVGMYDVVGTTLDYEVSAGIEFLVYIIAFLSINVGFINILPFPAFDGGHVLFLIIEKIKGSKVDEKIENTCHLIGFALIILLMIIVTINDIIKLM